MENYNGSIELISGLIQKNNGTFPLLNSEQIQIDETGNLLSDFIDNLLSIKKYVGYGLTQPTDIENGLWIKIDNINNYPYIITDNINQNIVDTITTSSTVLTNKMSQMSTCNVGSKCYIFGGYDGTKFLDSIQIYDTLTDTITTSTTVLLIKTGSSSSCTIGSKCYIFGGYDGTKFLDSIQIYDTLTDTITTSKLLTSVTQTSACSVETKCYIFGGNNGSSLNTIQIYDTLTDTITTSTTVLLIKTYSASACNVGTKCYIFRGTNDASLTNIQIYDTLTDIVTTTQSTDLIDRSYASSACNVGSKCYIFGGYNGTSYLDTIQIYDTGFFECYIILKDNSFNNNNHIVNVSDGEAISVNNVYNGLDFNKVSCYRITNNKAILISS